MGPEGLVREGHVRGQGVSLPGSHRLHSGAPSTGLLDHSSSCPESVDVHPTPGWSCLPHPGGCAQPASTAPLAAQAQQSHLPATGQGAKVPSREDGALGMGAAGGGSSQAWARAATSRPPQTEGTWASRSCHSLGEPRVPKAVTIVDSSKGTMGRLHTQCPFCCSLRVHGQRHQEAKGATPGMAPQEGPKAEAQAPPAAAPERGQVLGLAPLQSRSSHTPHAAQPPPSQPPTRCLWVGLWGQVTTG